MRKQRTSVKRGGAARAPLAAEFRAQEYPSIRELRETRGLALFRKLGTAVRRAAAAGSAVALVACHGQSGAVPPPTATLEPQHPPPAPTATPALPAPPATPPPIPSTAAASDPVAQLHEGDPCPHHAHGTVLTAIAAARLPLDQQAALHPIDGLSGVGTGTIGGIGVLGRPSMLGGGGSGMQPELEVARVSGDVRVERVVVTGGPLAQPVAERLVRSRLAAVRACYERELRNDPTVAGRVEVGFELGPTGRVTMGEVTESTVGNANVESCVRSVLLRLATTPGPDHATSQLLCSFVFAPTN